jgi:ketosteroid isomerase-like protein
MPEDSTTPDLVELGRGLFEAANRRDFDAILLRYAPDALWDMNPLGGLGTFEGHIAIRGFWEDWYASYEEFEIEAEETLDLGNGVGFTVRNPESPSRWEQREVRLRYALVSLWVRGLVVRLTNYGDIDEGRAAAERLAEERRQAMPPQNLEELVRWGYDWFNREKEPPPTWLPDGEFVNAREDPDHSIYRGIDAIRKQHQGWFDSYPDLHVEPLEIRANGGRVFVWTRFPGTGPTAASPWKWNWRTSSPWKTAALDGWKSISTAPKPSEPWG